MKIIIIYDNTSLKADLKADWGFSALIEAHGRKILFDTGANGRILLENMSALNINPKDITDIFISHFHFDHIGGLSHFLNENNNIVLHSPPSFRGVRYAREVHYYNKPQKIYKNIYTSGELAEIEQSMAFETEKGLMIITGCSHPPMKKILGRFSQFGTVFGIAGGFHDFEKFKLFNGMKLISPMHCTKNLSNIRLLYPEQFISGGAGQVIEF